MGGIAEDGGFSYSDLMQAKRDRLESRSGGGVTGYSPSQSTSGYDPGKGVMGKINAQHDIRSMLNWSSKKDWGKPMQNSAVYGTSYNQQKYGGTYNPWGDGPDAQKAMREFNKQLVNNTGAAADEYMMLQQKKYDKGYVERMGKDASWGKVENYKLWRYEMRYLSTHQAAGEGEDPNYLGTPNAQVIDKSMPIMEDDGTQSGPVIAGEATRADRARGKAAINAASGRAGRGKATGVQL